MKQGDIVIGLAAFALWACSSSAEAPSRSEAADPRTEGTVERGADEAPEAQTEQVGTAAAPVVTIPSTSRSIPAAVSAYGAGDLAVDSAGHIYFTSGGRRIYQLVDGVVSVVTGGLSMGHRDGPVEEAVLSRAFALATHGDVVYFLDDAGLRRIRDGMVETVSRHRVFRRGGSDELTITPDGTILIAPSGQNAIVLVRGVLPDGGPPTIERRRVIGPEDVAVDPSGTVYVLSMGRLLTVGPNGERVRVADGLEHASSLTIDPAGNVFVTSGNDGLFRLEDDHFVPVGGASEHVRDGPLEEARFAFVGAIAALGVNELVVGDGTLLRRVDARSVVTLAGAAPPRPYDIATFAVTPSGEVLARQSGEDGVRWVDEEPEPFDVPRYRVIFARRDGSILYLEPAEGRLYVRDAEGDRPLSRAPRLHALSIAAHGSDIVVSGEVLRRLDGDFFSPIATTGPRVRAPYGIAFGPDGTLYVADHRSDRILTVRDGAARRLAGSEDYAEDGLFGPLDIAVADDGTVYFTNTTGTVVLRVRDGEVTTYAGTGMCGFGDGPREQATFCHLSGIGVAPSGTVYVADGPRVRAITETEVRTLPPLEGPSTP